VQRMPPLSLHAERAILGKSYGITGLVTMRGGGERPRKGDSITLQVRLEIFPPPLASIVRSGEP